MISPRRAFKADRSKYYYIGFGCTKPPLTKRVRIWLFNYGLHCVACYRFGQFSNSLYRRNKILGLIPALLHLVVSSFVHMVYHVDIDAATIGPGLYIGHIGTIHIGPTVIGRNFSLSHNVTIGVGHSEATSGIPTVGDDVWVGTGSIISGAITIGNRVAIANGCILSRSVPDGCLVSGNPGRVILNEYDNRKLLCWVFDEESMS